MSMANVEQSEEVSTVVKTLDGFPAVNGTCDNSETEVSWSNFSKAALSNADRSKIPENRELDYSEKGLDVNADCTPLERDVRGNQSSEAEVNGYSTSGDSTTCLHAESLINQQPQSNLEGTLDCTFAASPLDGKKMISRKDPRLRLHIDDKSESENCSSETDSNAVADSERGVPLPEGAQSHSFLKLTSNDKKSDRNKESNTHSESPCSEFSASSSVTSYTEDSGISSTLRDEELEEIPLDSTAFNPELFKKMSKMCVDDIVEDWQPQTSNTYAPGVRRTRGEADPQDNQNIAVKSQKPSKIM